MHAHTHTHTHTTLVIKNKCTKLRIKVPLGTQASIKATWYLHHPRQPARCNLPVHISFSTMTTHCLLVDLTGSHWLFNDCLCLESNCGYAHTSQMRTHHKCAHITNAITVPSLYSPSSLIPSLLSHSLPPPLPFSPLLPSILLPSPWPHPGSWTCSRWTTCLNTSNPPSHLPFTAPSL